MPFVAPSIPVGTDFPKHALVANVLAHYHDPKLAYDRHFDIILGPRATMLGEIVLAVLARFVDAFLAVKLYLVLFVLTLWLGGRFLLGAAGQPTAAALLLLPIAHSCLVFSGFLPFIGSIAVFPFLAGVLLRFPAGPRRTLLIAGLLLLLFGFHTFGAAVGSIVLAIFAFWPERGRMRPIGAIALDLLALVPVIALIGWTELQSNAAKAKAVFAGPLGQLKIYFGYNIWPLSLRAGWLLGAGLLVLAAAAGLQIYRRKTDRRLLVCTVLLVVMGLVLPVQAGAAFIIGSRTLPFAVILAVAMLRFTKRGLAIGLAAASVILVGSAVLNTAAALRVQGPYRIFLSGLDVVPYGSRLISVVQDLSLGGNKYIQPFAGIEDAYAIYRGGSTGYALATPLVPTGGAALRLKYDPRYTWKYVTGVRPDYRGVGKVYDYVLVYGNPPAIAPIQTELDKVFENGPLAIYKSRERGVSASGPAPAESQ